MFIFQISALPSDVATLGSLTELDLRDNAQLRDVPREIGALKNLKKLDLFGNKLKTLPVGT